MKRLFALFLTLILVLPVFAWVLPVGAHNAANIEAVEAKYFDVKPVIDGYISEAEWGEATVWMLQSSDNPALNPTTIGGTTPYPNRFFYNEPSYAADSNDMEYYLWLRWDENYFYIGAKVYDPDGHSLQNGRSNTWNGDALQVRIDPGGANSICYGDTFHPEAYPNTYAADGTTVIEYGHKPWLSKNVCDLIFGYVEGAGGYKEAWNNTPNHNKSMLLNSAYTQANGFVDLAIAPAGLLRDEKNYSLDTGAGITTYEVAIPWKYIDYNRTNAHEYYKNGSVKKLNPDGTIKQGPDGAIGYEYGMSAVVYNADGAANGNELNAALGWGSGIATRQLWDDSFATCAGSNAVTLSGDKVSEDVLYSTDYKTYRVGGPEEITPWKEFDKEINFDIYKHLTYDDEADMEIFGGLSNGERVQLEDGNWVVKWDKATEFDTPDETTGEMPTHNTANYLSTDGEDSDNPRYVNEGVSFTFEFDVMVTGLETYENSYGSAIYNWFGGTSSVDYQCGYFFDESKFKIVNTNDPSEVVLEKAYDLELNEWHHWVFQYDDETCFLRFYIDPKMDGDVVHYEERPLFETAYKYFDYGSIEKTILIFRRMNAQIMMDNIKFYNFVNFEWENPEPPVIETIKTTTENVELEITKRDDGTFEIAILNADSYKATNLKGLTFKAVYDAQKLELKGIEGVDESKYTLTDDGSGNLTIVFNDLSYFKDFETGDKTFKLIVATKNGAELTAEDVSKLVTMTADIKHLSAQTGDSVLWIGAVVVAATLLGMGIVIYRRKRNTVEF